MRQIVACYLVALLKNPWEFLEMHWTILPRTKRHKGEKLAGYLNFLVL